jgi:hypothetical protein
MVITVPYFGRATGLTSRDTFRMIKSDNTQYLLARAGIDSEGKDKSEAVSGWRGFPVQDCRQPQIGPCRGIR